MLLKFKEGTLKEINEKYHLTPNEKELIKKTTNSEEPIIYTENNNEIYIITDIDNIVKKVLLKLIKKSYSKYLTSIRNMVYWVEESNSSGRIHFMKVVGIPNFSITEIEKNPELKRRLALHIHYTGEMVLTLFDDFGRPTGVTWNIRMLMEQYMSKYEVHGEEHTKKVLQDTDVIFDYGIPTEYPKYYIISDKVRIKTVDYEIIDYITEETPTGETLTMKALKINVSMEVFGKEVQTTKTLSKLSSIISTILTHYNNVESILERLDKVYGIVLTEYEYKYMDTLSKAVNEVKKINDEKVQKYIEQIKDELANTLINQVDGFECPDILKKAKSFLDKLNYQYSLTSVHFGDLQYMLTEELSKRPHTLIEKTPPELFREITGMDKEEFIRELELYNDDTIPKRIKDTIAHDMWFVINKLIEYCATGYTPVSE